MQSPQTHIIYSLVRCKVHPEP